uniref:Uncharacterized protein n=1 Tax=Solanum lycopersicum TaxID=4081 RepID=K4B211_SOLLC
MNTSIRYRPAVRISGFHPGDPGSIPAVRISGFHPGDPGLIPGNGIF